MYDIITFGSATWDIFIKLTDFKEIKNKNFVTGRKICFDLGSKIDIKDVNFSSGGGGTNTAVAFANQGLKTAYCGKVGDDISGREIIEDLKKRGVNVDFIVKTKLKPTNHSIVISAVDKERTILAYRGASEILKEKEIPWFVDGPRKIKTTPIAKWFYLAPLSGELSQLFEKIVDYAKKENIKIAANLGNSQLNLEKNLLKKTIKKLDVLILNQEEASILTGISYKQENRIFKKIGEMCDGIVIITKGEKGVSLFDGKYIYKAGVLKIKVIDKTGAGDAFSAGFISEFLKSGNIQRGIQLGTANAANCISKLGAKFGLLSEKDKFRKIKVKKLLFKLCGPNSRNY